MAKKKKQAAPAAKKPVVPAKNNRTMIWIVVGVLVLAGVAAFVLGSRGGATTLDQSGAAGDLPAATADVSEAKYIGRFLPKGYTEPSVAAPTKYSTTVKMTNLTAASADGKVSVAKADVTAKKIVLYQATNKAGDVVPIIAFVKPSGKLFVGVSYCLPCKGTGQRIETDGTMTCESCGTKRDLETMAGISGACRRYPLDELPATVSGDRISIDQAAVDNWTAQPMDRPTG